MDYITLSRWCNMQISKLGCLATHLPGPPGATSSRSGWVVQQLRQAFSQGLCGIDVPEALVVRFSVALPGDVARMLDEASEREGHAPALTCARLIAAVLAKADEAAADAPVAAVHHAMSSDLDYQVVRPVLHPLMTATHEAMRDGKIVFAEASTGSGKGRMIAALAKTWSARGPVVISAPLAVSRQLLSELKVVCPEVRPRMLLGRANFIDPDLLDEWLSLNPDEALQSWFDGGGRPSTPSTVALQQALGMPLA